MSLESCPTCGYALSISDSKCRNCLHRFEARPWFRRWDARLLLNAVLFSVAVSILVYRLFFAH